MKKTTLLAGVATGALAIAAPAHAADLRMPVKASPIAAPVPYFSWTGCYIGAHVGWGWGNKDFNNPRNGNGSAEPSLAGTVDQSGAIFGGQLGCNYQFANAFVLGIEGSVAGADINGTGGSPGCESSVLHAKTDFLASVTGRLGWAGWDPRVLFYVKGGAAWAHDKLEQQISSENFFVDQDRTGWTIGLGVEWAFAQNWSAFAEWDHYDFGTRNSCFGCGHSTLLHFDVKQRIETVKIGVNYRFDLGLLGVGKGIGKSPVTARY